MLHNSGSLPGSTSYTYDAAGNRLTKTAVQVGNPNPVSVLSQYSYDPIYELTQALVGGSVAESYTYDPVGNRLTSAGPVSYTYNISNELTSSSAATYAYDNDGNTTSKTTSAGTTSYTWDFENRLSSVTLPGTGGTVNFEYDPFGRRIYKSSSAGTYIYVYDGDNVIQELNGAGSLAAQYTQGLGIDEPLAIYQGTSTDYFHADGLGSVMALTDPTGAVDNSYVYDSFGNLTTSNGTVTNPFQYTGREFDSETGLFYYRARYYDPSASRFLSEDPTEFDGGINFYGYAANSPTSFIDPLGLAECVYSVAQHTMVCTSSNPPPPVGPQWQMQLGPDGVASGAGTCKNNDNCVNKRNQGPITPGRYKMNLDTRPQHAGRGVYRLEPWPHNWYDGLLYDLDLTRGGFELHLGSVTFGCINADKTNPQAVNDYQALQQLLQAEDGNNYLTVVP